jgi:rubredoxin
MNSSRPLHPCLSLSRSLSLALSLPPSLPLSLPLYPCQTCARKFDEDSGASEEEESTLEPGEKVCPREMLPLEAHEPGDGAEGEHPVVCTLCDLVFKDNRGLAG